jgi:bla regulator protein BlaR1
MSPEADYTLAQAMLASTFAVVLIAILRKPLRYAFGARAAYGIWLLVPASAFIILLPIASKPFYTPRSFLSPPVRLAVSGALRAMNHAGVSTDSATMVLAAWAGGALIAVAFLLSRHLAFVRSLGVMTLQPDGSLRATDCVDPVLLGVVRPRVVLPTDFDSRYDENERVMILTHERAHLGRRDAQINAVAAVWLCCSWFNPLMYWAATLFRFDQELACDATVLAKPGASPRRYAKALFKTQLGADVAKRRSALGCHWHSTHPLKERISMLKRPLPRGLRRNIGFILTLAIVALGCYAVKSAQAEVPLPQSQGPLIALHVRWLVNDAVVPIMADRMSDDALLRSGGKLRKLFKTPELGSNEMECTVKSSNGSNPSSSPDESGEFLISCKVFKEGQVVMSPTVLTRDGETAILRSGTTPGDVTTLELNASSSAARITAAREAMKSEARMPLKEGAKRFILRTEPSEQPGTEAEPPPH